MTGSVTTRPARRFHRYLAGPLIALAVVAPLAAPAGPASAASPDVEIDIDNLDPAVAGPNSTLRVAGSVSNSGDLRLRDVQVRLRLSRSRVNSRAELARVAAGDTESKDGDVIAQAPVADALPRGDRGSFQVAYSLPEAGNLDEFGVFVVSVEVVASSPEGFGRVGIVRTFIPFVPQDPGFRPAGYSWLWPLVGAPKRLADGTYADDRLAADLAPSGRLDRLLRTGVTLAETQNLTWVVDPELLETVQDMADGYSVLSATGPRVEGTGQQDAAQWLAALRTATTARDVVALPYADPDLVALHRHDLDTDVAAAFEAGAEVAAEVLGRAVVGDLVWPADGFVNRSTLAALQPLGLRGVVLDGRALPTRFPLNYTPSGRATARVGGRNLAALVHDPGLTDLLAEPVSGSPLLSGQRFIAETAMITAELPSTGTDRVIVVAPPRRWRPNAVMLDRIVESAAQSPWLGPVSLDAALAAPPPEVDRSPLRYPKELRRAELPATYLAALQEMRSDTAIFTSVLTEPTSIATRFERSVLRLESSWWRRRESREDRLALEQIQLERRMGLVRVLPGSYTFASKNGSIPVTISNRLPQDVIVDVALTPRTRRLQIGQVDPVRIGPERKVQIEVPATAVANGLVIVDARLQTPAGTTFNPEVPLRIRVTQLGTVALFITLGAAGVLFLAAGFRLFRRIRVGRRGSGS